MKTRSKQVHGGTRQTRMEEHEALALPCRPAPTTFAPAEEAE